MVLIGSEDFDATTTLVMQWLDFYKIPFYRINKEDDIQLSDVFFDNSEIAFDIIINQKTIIKSKEITSFWYRRGGTSIKSPNVVFNKSVSMEEEVRIEISKAIRRESITLEDFFGVLLENNKCFESFGNPNNSVNNKLIHLKLASEVGLKIPKTYLINNKKTLIDKLGLHLDGLITKPMGDSAQISFEKNSKEYKYFLYTNQVTNDDLAVLPDRFGTSLFQEKILKKVELRIFYFNNQCFTSAIFSQFDEKTQEDFRRYNWVKPNRYVPFSLPGEIEEKVHRFMSLARLDTGSLDFIYAKNKDFYFLEVNPVGQFGMISLPCNFFIEKKIAGLLKNNLP